LIQSENAHPSLFVRLFGDRGYYAALVTIALPIALQNLITSSLSMVSVVFIGQLGDDAVAALGLANQAFFLLNLALFGVFSGTAMFTAQLWGKRNLAGIHKVLGLSMGLGLIVAVIFFSIAVFFPRQFLSIYSTDQAVIGLGTGYLRLFGPSYFFFTITFCFASVLRSTGQVRLPVTVSTIALILNTILNYVLIFGLFGLPAMGLRGAALASTFARFLECTALVAAVYLTRSPVAASLKQMFGFDRIFAWRVLKPVLPITAQEIAWSLGVTTYNAIYGRLGTESIAAMNIVGTIDQLGMVAIFSMGTACAIIVGNKIGEENVDRAYWYAGWTLRLAMVTGVVVGVLIFLFSPLILNLYDVSAQVIYNAHRVLNVLACVMWIRASNTILIVGILRSGGDTRFSFLLETGTMWCIGVVMASLGAFVFHLPVYWVYALAMLDECTKFVICNWRYYSKRWIHNLAQTV
jgi:putative MATE family efflux protein